MEFLYTRQQMEGFKGYQCKVKIGNWSEDMELEAVSGPLPCQASARRIRPRTFRRVSRGATRSRASDS